MERDFCVRLSSYPAWIPRAVACARLMSAKYCRSSTHSFFMVFGDPEPVVPEFLGVPGPVDDIVHRLPVRLPHPRPRPIQQ